MKNHFKFLVTIKVLLIICHLSFSQKDTSLFKHYQSENNEWLSNINGILYIDRNASDYVNGGVFVNDVAYPQALNCKSPFILHKGKVYFTSYNSEKDNYLLFAFNKNTFERVYDFGPKNYVILGKDSCLVHHNEKLEIFGYADCNKRRELKFPDSVMTSRELVEVNNLFGKGFLISYGADEGGYVDFSYILYNGKAVKYINPGYTFRDPDILLEIPFVDETDEMYYVKTIGYDKENKQRTKDLIYDKAFKPVSVVLKKSKFHVNDIVGYNYQSGLLDSYNIKSVTDTDEKLIIPYRFVPELEIGMFRIITDSLLTENDYSNMGYYELKCLLNCVYAKHNIAFDSKYFQAFFNIYNFYNMNDNKSRRLKNVDALLTTNDKLNIKLISDKLAPYKKQYENFIIK